MALVAAGCGSTPSAGIAIHMKRGSQHFECAEIARDNVLAAEWILAPKKGHDTEADDDRAADASFAAIREAADQLPSSDPVRVAALGYVARGRTYPYFALCRHEMYLADVGELRMPAR